MLSSVDYIRLNTNVVITKNFKYFLWRKQLMKQNCLGSMKITMWPSKCIFFKKQPK